VRQIRITLAAASAGALLGLVAGRAVPDPPRARVVVLVEGAGALAGLAVGLVRGWRRA
jgi:hypothetical protein